MTVRVLLSPRLLCGMWAETMAGELKKHGIREVGVASDLPARFIVQARSACKVHFYSSSMRADDDTFAVCFPQLIEDVRAIGAETLCVLPGLASAEALDKYVSLARESGITLLYNTKGARVSELVARRAPLALDTGDSHLRSNALEDFYDSLPCLRAVLLSDNDGETDEPLAPGYGTLPVGALGEALRRERPDADAYICGRPRQDFPFADPDLGLLLRETRAALSGRVPVNPAGGWLARDRYTGRILV